MTNKTGKRRTIDRLGRNVSRFKAKRKAKRQQRVNKAQRQGLRGIRNYFTFLNLVVFIGFILICYITAFLYSFTADVYVSAFASMGQGSGIGPDGLVVIDLNSAAVRQWPLVGPLVALPLQFVENFINNLETNYLGVIGAVAFLFLQTGELIPTVIWESPALMLHLIERMDKTSKTIALKNTDTDAVRRLKVRHNQYYSNFLETLEDLRIWCFVIDILICFFLVPTIWLYSSGETANLVPFLEGVRQLDFDWSYLDSASVFKVFSSIFGLLGLVKVGMLVFNGFSKFARNK